jgi:hypothetical protein
MSRITRLWRRASALFAPPLVKAHAIRNGQIVEWPGLHVPVFRAPMRTFLLASGSGGPTFTDGDWPTMVILGSDDGGSPVVPHLATLVSDLENLERWLEVGTATIQTDFIAFRDLVDMSHDIVPGTWQPGLPDLKDMPGITTLADVTTDIFARAICRKNNVNLGTDRDIIFPVPWDSDFSERIPIAEFGQPHPIYSHTLLGMIKFGLFDDEAVGSKAADVSSAARFFGTDHWVRDNYTLANQDIYTVFGGDQMEGVSVAPTGGRYSVGDYWDVDGSEYYTSLMTHDPMRFKHIWDAIRFADAFSWGNYWERVVDENRQSALFWSEPEDICTNYAELIGKAFGIPYFRGA